MKDLKQQYIDFVDYFFPYWSVYEDPDDVINISLSDMLYNLEELKKDIEVDLEPDDEKKLDEVIAAFKAAGITV